MNNKYILGSVTILTGLCIGGIVGYKYGYKKATDEFNAILDARYEDVKAEPEASEMVTDSVEGENTMSTDDINISVTEETMCDIEGHSIPVTTHYTKSIPNIGETSKLGLDIEKMVSMEYPMEDKPYIEYFDDPDEFYDEVNDREYLELIYTTDGVLFTGDLEQRILEDSEIGFDMFDAVDYTTDDGSIFVINYELNKAFDITCVDNTFGQYMGIDDAK